MAQVACPSTAYIDEDLVFSVITYNPGTGVLTDADAVPDWRIYEDETGAAILNGTMSLLDAGNTDGFYTELVEVTAANGFEAGKNYTIYVDTTVGAAAIGFCGAFKARLSVADAVWDEVLSAGAHATLFSAGRRLQNLVLRAGTLVDAGANWVELPGPWSAINGTYEENIISVIDGAGAGQTRLIVEYVGATRRAYVDRPWATNPAGGDEIELLPFSGILLTDHGVAVGGAAFAIELAATASAVDDIYIGSMIVISSGTGLGQARLIVDYDGASQQASIQPAWTTNPDATSVYKIIPVGRSIVDAVSDDGVADIWAASTRTLTQSAVTIASAVSGSDIAIYRGDTFSASLTGLGALAGYVSLDFTVKHSASDADASAVLRIRLNAGGLDDGLLTINGAAAVTAANGSITIDDPVAGDITIALTADEAAKLLPQSYLYYDVQLIGAGGAVHTLTYGNCSVTADVTRTVT